MTEEQNKEQESLEERLKELKAEKDIPQDVLDATEAYFQIEEDIERALQKLIDLRVIGIYNKAVYVRAIEKAKQAKDPAQKAKEIADIYGQIRKDVLVFVGGRLSKVDEKELDASTKITIYTSCGERFFEEFELLYEQTKKEKKPETNPIGAKKRIKPYEDIINDPFTKQSQKTHGLGMLAFSQGRYNLARNYFKSLLSDKSATQEEKNSASMTLGFIEEAERRAKEQEFDDFFKENDGQTR